MTLMTLLTKENEIYQDSSHLIHKVHITLLQSITVQFKLQTGQDRIGQGDREKEGQHKLND